MNRGELTNIQWETAPHPCSHPKNRRLGDPPMTIARSSMASCGCCALGRPGAICLNEMVPGAPWPVASTAGGGRASGAALGGGASISRRPWPAELGRAFYRWHDDPSPSACGWGKKREPRVRSPGPEPGRVQYQSPPASRRGRPADDPRPHPWTAARGDGLCIAHGERGRQAAVGQAVPSADPHRLVGNKGYSSGRIRQYARQHGIRISIPCKRNECRTGLFDRGIDRLRNWIERLIDRCKQFRVWRRATKSAPSTIKPCG